MPIFGSVGLEGVDTVGARQLEKLGVKLFILEVTKDPTANITDMASTRGDGQPYHWRIPFSVWPTVVMYMNYMSEGKASQNC